MDCNEKFIVSLDEKIDLLLGYIKEYKLISEKLDNITETVILFQQHIKPENGFHHRQYECQAMKEHREEHKENKRFGWTQAGVIISLLVGAIGILIKILA